MRKLQVLEEEPIAAMQPLLMRTTRNTQPVSGISELRQPARLKVKTSIQKYRRIFYLPFLHCNFYGFQMNNPSELVKDANSSTVSADGLYTVI